MNTLVPIDDGGARHLVPGVALPDVAVPAMGGESVSLARLPGASVVYCYTWTGRPGLPDPPGWDDIAGAHGSTPQTEAFRDLHAEFVRRGVRVFGLSLQDADYQREMVERLEIPFAVLSDAAFTFSRALNLPTFQTGGITYLKRLALVIEDGKIAKTFYPVHPPADNAGKVLAWLESQRASD